MKLALVHFEFGQHYVVAWRDGVWIATGEDIGDRTARPTVEIDPTGAPEDSWLVLWAQLAVAALPPRAG